MTHSLDFSLDQELVKEYRYAEMEVNENDPDLWVVTVQCLNFVRPAANRDCRYWIECGHTNPSVCSASPDGTHYLTNGVGRYWSDWCWAEECDETIDKAIKLIQNYNLSFGSYMINVEESGENHIEFSLADEV